jgi:hypothetical protein
MKKSELKALLKPLIKECIKESILEDGILSNIITEVTKGLSSNTIVEAKEPKPQVSPKPKRNANEQFAEYRKKLMSAIGSDTYGGVDLFEGTTPAPGQRSPEAQAANPLGDTDPSDAGIDISGFMAASGNKWKSLI